MDLIVCIEYTGFLSINWYYRRHDLRKFDIHVCLELHETLSLSGSLLHLAVLSSKHD